MNKTLLYIATQEDDGKPLGTVLRQGLGLTARQIKQVKFLPDGLRINEARQRDGRLITTRTAVRQGDQIRVQFQEKSETVVPVAGELAIVYEDEDLVVVNKPAGLVAHPAHGHFTDTLVNRLAARYPEPIRLIGRLDKDTSGLIGAARSSIAATRMEQQRREHILSREYLALVKGQLQGAGRVEQPLTEKRSTLMQMVVDPEGKPAITEYRVWHSWDSCSLVWLRLQTGRTHQIRVHMAWLGHPLLGDRLYGEEQEDGLKRAALHSWRIQARQPFSGERLAIMALPPDDFKSKWEVKLMNELKEYMERLTFPPEAVDALLEKTEAAIDVLGHRYMAEELTLTEALEELGSDYGRHMVFLVSCLPELRRRYSQAGLPEALFWHTMLDLKYKLMECHRVKGQWGTFVGHWFDWFYKMKRFTLGRLQFEKVIYQGEIYERAGVTVRPGDTVVNMHIPSAGPLTEKLRRDAYQQAYRFFPECRKEGALVLVCHSWLLDPVYQTFLPENSNVVSFQKDFDIVRVEKTDAFKDAWRVFGAEADRSAKELPRCTSMQRAFADFLAAGGQTGEGFGIILWDDQGQLA